MQRDVLQFLVRDHCVDHPHLIRLSCRVVAPEEEHLAGPFLADLAGQVGRAVAGVVGGHVGVGLLEDGVLLRGEGHVADDVEAVAAADRPAGDHADHDLGHEADEALHLEDVKTSHPARVDLITVGILVAVSSPDSLVATRTERPPPVLGRGAVSGQ